MSTNDRGNDAPVTLPHVSNEEIQALLKQSKVYSLVILRPGPRRNEPGSDAIILEHGKRNVALRAAGLLSVVCPVAGGGSVAGVGIFDAALDVVERLMQDDPAIKAGVLAHEIHACRSFPGDRLP